MSGTNVSRILLSSLRSSDAIAIYLEAAFLRRSLLKEKRTTCLVHDLHRGQFVLAPDRVFHPILLQISEVAFDATLFTFHPDVTSGLV